jgi:hypothetical protein
MKSLGSDIKIEYKPAPVGFKSRRDELVARITDGINAQRIGTKYKPTTRRVVALLINKNPFLSTHDDEIEYVANECERKGSYSFFYWLVKPPKNHMCITCGRVMAQISEHEFVCSCSPGLHLCIG